MVGMRVYFGGVCRAGRQPRHDCHRSLLRRLCGDGALTSVTAAERIAPVLCAAGIIAEFVAGVAGYYAVAAVWPNFYYTPITAGKVTWLALQAVCIAIYVIGVIWAYSGIKQAVRAGHALASERDR